MSIPYFDAHCDTLWQGWELESNPGHVDLKRLSAYEPMGQVFALYGDSAAIPEGERYPFIAERARRFREAKAAHPELMRNCCLSIEGAELMDCDAGKLETVRGWGVRWINLTWNHENALAGPHSTDHGLTRRGRDFVRRLWELGMAVDVSHLSDRGFWEIMELGDGPVLASHSDCRALCPHSRNLTDDMARAVFRRGGFVGVNFYNNFLGENPTFDTIAEHIEHYLDLGGEDGLGTGSDFDGGELALTGVEELPCLWETLERRGHSPALIEKLAFGNLSRFIKGLKSAQESEK